MRWLLPIACLACTGQATPRDVRPQGPARPRAVELAALGNTACARLDTGRVRCWGHIAGRVAATPVELAVERATAIDIAHGHVYVVGDGVLYAQPIKEAGAPRVIARGIAQISVGYARVATLGRDGAVGRFDDTLLDAIEPLPAPPNLVAIRVIEPGYCGIERAGGMHCWDGVSTTVLPLTDAVAFAGGDREVCVRRATDRLVCWQPPMRAHSVGHPRPFTSADGSVDIAWIAAQRDHVCELSIGRQVSCAGLNRNGTIGNGTRTDEMIDRSDVALDAPATGLATGIRFACALLDDGDVACWGRNAFGTIGDGTLVDRPSPVRVAHLRAHRLPPARDGRAALPVPSLVMDWSELPAACTRPERVAALGRSFPYVSAYATVRPMSFSVTIASYDVDDLDEAPRGAQEEISIHFQDTIRATPGVYPAGGQTLILVTHDAQLVPQTKEAGTRVTISHADATWLCGEVEVAGAVVPFSARVRRR